MATQPKAHIQLLTIKQHELARLEVQVAATRQAWHAESETLNTLLSYQRDYSSLNEAQWKNSDSLSTLHRLKNGSRFTANLSLAIDQQREKARKAEQRHQKLLDQWNKNIQLKQKLEDIIEEKRLKLMVESERRQEQLESEARINLDSFRQH